MNRRNIIILVITLITVFNIGVISKFLYDHYAVAEKQSDTSEIQLPDRQYARWFQEQLNLDQDQFLVFRDANRSYHYEGRIILTKLDSLRAAMLDELNKKEPNQIKLEGYALEIGGLHARLKKLTISYYQQMKDACNDEQKEKLYLIFKSMLDEEGNAKIPQ